MVRRTREDAPIRRAKIEGEIDLPVRERLDFYIAKSDGQGTPVSLDKILQLCIDEFLRKYGMC